MDDAVYKAFSYRHMGSLAYVGNGAVFEINGMSFGGGLVFLYLWRSAYFAQSVSMRTRILLAMDWTKRALFGRGEFLESGEIWARLTCGCRLDELLEEGIGLGCG